MFSIVVLHLPAVGGAKVTHSGISYHLGVKHPDLTMARAPGDDVRIANPLWSVDRGLDLQAWSRRSRAPGRAGLYELAGACGTFARHAPVTPAYLDKDHSRC